MTIGGEGELRGEPGVGAWSEARRLDHHWVGEEHVLLALVRGGGVAGDVLRRAGATPERLEATIRTGLERADPPVERRSTETLSPTAAVYRLFGRAEGLALARGTEPTPDDVLVALVWHAGLGASLLRALDVDRASLAVALARAGLAVPPGEPEPLDLRPRKRVDVPYERLGELLRVLPARLPEGSRFGFNLHHETRRAWIVVDEEVDAERLAEEVLAGRPDGASVAGE